MPCGRYGNYLLEADARKGLNVFDGFGIRDALYARYPAFNRNVYANLLRSEHVPFNFFIPLNSDAALRREVFSKWLGFGLSVVDEIRIEYAPMPRGEFLNDSTSFDAFVEYEDEAGLRGLVGIEVKYTERPYPLGKNSKEDRNILDVGSAYYRVMTTSGIYRGGWSRSLLRDEYRQLWRNQLLGESILQRFRERYAYATLMVVYPKDNRHVAEACTGYSRLLTQPEYTFKALTYEQFILDIREHTTSDIFLPWADYLQDRYIVPSQPVNQ
ncbi:MAG TPA: hypothetical protein PLB89_01835 [Flavobacteriales bacterium]|nr:hypothetical protein [Flavobacteriales bacterium]